MSKIRREHFYQFGNEITRPVKLADSLYQAAIACPSSGDSEFRLTLFSMFLRHLFISEAIGPHLVDSAMVDPIPFSEWQRIILAALCKVPHYSVSYKCVMKTELMPLKNMPDVRARNQAYNSIPGQPSIEMSPDLVLLIKCGDPSGKYIWIQFNAEVDALETDFRWFTLQDRLRSVGATLAEELLETKAVLETKIENLERQLALRIKETSDSNKLLRFLVEALADKGDHDMADLEREAQAKLAEAAAAPP
eukprot:TRINITY_DN22917_c0_g1_i1.p1 TRINITY_DN22917_c0_g1~~TRINITY_DN22917_c0_g1_i1.p1  ORF type:complete len:250 (-),score=31.24 TRINITY_DN22917_c0_g1_i1:170-919(-)